MCGGCSARRRKDTMVWRVTFRDGSAPEEFVSRTEARTVARQRGGTITQVPKTR